MFSLYKKIKIQNLPLCLYNNTADHNQSKPVQIDELACIYLVLNYEIILGLQDKSRGSFHDDLLARHTILSEGIFSKKAILDIRYKVQRFQGFEVV